VKDYFYINRLIPKEDNLPMSQFLNWWWNLWKIKCGPKL